jgi:hypothetical protein
MTISRTSLLARATLALAALGLAAPAAAQNLSTSVLRPTPIDAATGIVARDFPGGSGATSYYLAVDLKAGSLMTQLQVTGRPNTPKRIDFELLDANARVAASAFLMAESEAKRDLTKGLCHRQRRTLRHPVDRRRQGDERVLRPDGRHGTARGPLARLSGQGGRRGAGAASRAARRSRAGTGDGCAAARASSARTSRGAGRRGDRQQVRGAPARRRRRPVRLRSRRASSRGRCGTRPGGGAHQHGEEGGADRGAHRRQGHRELQSRPERAARWRGARRACRARLPAEWLRTRGLGKSYPVAPNQRADGSDDPDGRQKNRRVEVVINTCS